MMCRNTLVGCSLAFSMLLSRLVGAATCPDRLHAESGERTVALAELYTSEGCDSCPPADRWFSSIRNRNDVIPLAFHVDYWDYIGWKDRFAQPGFAERQRQSVARQGGRVTYTPQVMLDGRDARGVVASSRFDSLVRDIAARPATTLLIVDAERSATAMTVKVKSRTSNPLEWRQADLFLALTEDGLSSRVTAGENRGATLAHDHVVRWIGSPASFVNGEFPGLREFSAFYIPLNANWNREKLTLVAFAQDRVSGHLLQAIALSVCN